MSRFTFRRGVPADARAINSTRCAVIRDSPIGFFPLSTSEELASYQDTTPNIDAFAKKIAAEEEIVIIIELPMTVVGFSSFSPSDGVLRALYIHSGYMGCGLGHELLRHIEREAREQNVREMRLSVPFQSQTFYANNGFLVVGPDATVIGSKKRIGTISMSKKL